MTLAIITQHLFLTSLSLMLIASALSSCSSPLDNIPPLPLSQKIPDMWAIGIKLHFEEESGSDYIGINDMNAASQQVIKSSLPVIRSTCAKNAKIQLVRFHNGIEITHYTEKMNPLIGEEMHATILYTRPRGFCDSETLTQVCPHLFDSCITPPSIEATQKRYQAMIHPDWRLVINTIYVFKGKGTITFSASLLLQGKSNIYIKD